MLNNTTEKISFSHHYENEEGVEIVAAAGYKDSKFTVLYGFTIESMDLDLFYEYEDFFDFLINPHKKYIFPNKDGDFMGVDIEDQVLKEKLESSGITPRSSIYQFFIQVNNDFLSKAMREALDVTRIVGQPIADKRKQGCWVCISRIKTENNKILYEGQWNRFRWISDDYYKLLEILENARKAQIGAVEHYKNHKCFDIIKYQLDTLPLTELNWVEYDDASAYQTICGEGIIYDTSIELYSCEEMWKAKIYVEKTIGVTPKGGGIQEGSVSDIFADTKEELLNIIETREDLLDVFIDNYQEYDFFIKNCVSQLKLNSV